MAGLTFGLAALVSYGAQRGWTERAPAGAEAEAPFPTGRHLVAFVLLSSECGFCQEKGTREAVGGLRDALRAAHGGAFARVSVLGIAIDEDVGGGLEYLRSLGKGGSAFDEVSVGGSWLNESVVALVWRDGAATPAVPQVVVVERDVDASRYPDVLDVGLNRVLKTVRGRDSLIAWVRAGTVLARDPEAH